MIASCARNCSTAADFKFSAEVQIFAEKINVSNAQARQKNNRCEKGKMLS
jgi:hypothetical protein